MELRSAFEATPDLMIVWHEHGVDVMVEPAGSGKTYEGGSDSYKVARTGHFGALFEFADGPPRKWIEPMDGGDSSGNQGTPYVTSFQVLGFVHHHR